MGIDDQFSQGKSKEATIRTPSRCPVNHDAKSRTDVLGGSRAARELHQQHSLAMYKRSCRAH